jgi:hypothetical protein
VDGLRFKPGGCDRRAQNKFDLLRAERARLRNEDHHCGQFRVELLGKNFEKSSDALLPAEGHWPQATQANLGKLTDELYLGLRGSIACEAAIARHEAGSDTTSEVSSPTLRKNRFAPPHDRMRASAICCLGKTKQPTPKRGIAQVRSTKDWADRPATPDFALKGIVKVTTKSK